MRDLRERINKLNAEIDAMKSKISPLLKNKVELERLLDEAVSKEFIEINNITKDKVISPDDSGVPYFGIVTEFGKWIAENSDLPWCEWNGRLYLSSEICAGRMSPNAPGRYEDVK